MVSLELLNGVHSGNGFEKKQRILNGKWKRPRSAIKHRAGSADHTISSLVHVQRDYYFDRDLSYTCVRLIDIFADYTFKGFDTIQLVIQMQL